MTQSGARFETLAEPMPEETEPAPPPDGHRIVGIGASAGGLESLENLFAALPKTPGWASSWSSISPPTSAA